MAKVAAHVLLTLVAVAATDASFVSTEEQFSFYAPTGVLTVTDLKCGWRLFPDFANVNLNLSAIEHLPWPEFGNADFSWFSGTYDPDVFFSGCGFRAQCEAKMRTGRKFKSWGVGEGGDSFTIPTEIGLLTNLKSMTFGCLDELHGPIPTEIGLLTKLETLIIASTNLDGDIPWEQIAKLTNLRDFRITELCTSRYSFEGCCDNSLHYELDYVNVDKDTCPLINSKPELYDDAFDAVSPDPTVWSRHTGHRSTYRMLISPRPQIVGSKVDCLPRFSDYYVGVGSSRSTRVLMSEIFTEKRYNGLGTRKYLVSRIDPRVGNLTNLETLELTDVHLSGVIPTEIGNLRKLTSLQIRGLQLWNEFRVTRPGLSGTIPSSSLAQLTNLVTLEISGDVIPWQLHKLLQVDFTGDLIENGGMADVQIDYTGADPYLLFRRRPITGNDLTRNFSSWGLVHILGWHYDRFNLTKTWSPLNCTTRTLIDKDLIFNRLGVATALKTQSSTPTRRKYNDSFDLFIPTFGRKFGSGGSLGKTMFLNLTKLKSLALAHLPITGEFPDLPQQFYNNSNLWILNTLLTGKPPKLPTFAMVTSAAAATSSGNHDPPYFNTLFGNRFTASSSASAGDCVSSEEFDSLETKDAFFSSSEKSGFVSTFNPLFGDRFHLNDSQVNVRLGDIYLPGGILQNCMNTRETLLRRCDDFLTLPTRSSSSSTTTSTCLVKGNATQIAVLRKLRVTSRPVSCVGARRYRAYKVHATTGNDDMLWPFEDDDGDPCLDSWPGVTCDESGNIVALSLSGLFGYLLQGNLTSDIGLLWNLRFLDLSFNELTTVPTSLANLPHLERVDLSYNLLTTIPDKVVVHFSKVLSVPQKPSPGRYKELFQHFELANSVLAKLPDNLREEQIPVDLPTQIYFPLNGSLHSFRRFSMLYSSFEGNYIKEQPKVCQTFFASEFNDCSKLGLGDGNCDSYTFEAAMIARLGIDVASDQCHFNRFAKRKDQQAVPSLTLKRHCTICNEIETRTLENVFYSFIGLLCLFLVLAILLAAFSRKIPDQVVVGFRLVLSYFQVVSACFVPQLRIPQPLQGVLMLFTFSSFVLPGVEPGCLFLQNLNSDAYIFLNAEPAAILAFPLDGYFVLGLLSLVGITLRRYAARKLYGNSTNETSESSPSYVRNLEDDFWDAYTIKVPSLLVVPIAAMIARSTSLVAPFAMKNFDFGTGMSLFQIRASTNGAGLLFMLNLLFIVVVTVAYSYILYFVVRCANGKIEKRRALFLEREYVNVIWFAVELGFRTAIGVFAGISAIGVYLQQTMVAILLVAWLVVHTKYNFGGPYKLHAANRFQTGVLISQILLIFMILIWYSLQEEEDRVAEAITGSQSNTTTNNTTSAGATAVTATYQIGAVVISLMYVSFILALTGFVFVSVRHHVQELKRIQIISSSGTSLPQAATTSDLPRGTSFDQQQ